MLIRHAAPVDYGPVIAVLDHWWGRNGMTDMVPRLFFTRFRPTSFVAEQEGELRAFLCGFVSQTDPSDAYIHFVGVHPDERGAGLGRRLYERFFAEVAALGCNAVHCVTGPVNEGSRAFHAAMGFSSTVVADYDGKGDDRVVFRLDLAGARSELDAQIAGVAAAHRRLVATLEREPWEPASPSPLPGWSIGHVATHLARNADAVSGILRAVAAGEVGVQYPGGAAQRSADIEAGATRPRTEVLDDVRRAGAALDLELALTPATAWADGRTRSMLEDLPAAAWPMRRWREVEIHHVDLGLSFGWDDWSSPFVAREWTARVAELPARLDRGGCRLDITDEGVSEVAGADGGPTVTGSRRELLAWMLGRATIDGAPTLADAT